MSERLTVLIVSYHFAPSPAVGGKRFTFLARELERLGYDVQVISAALRESYHGKAMDDGSLPAGTPVSRCGETFTFPLRGKGWFVRAVNALVRRLLAPVGWEFFWIGPAVRQAVKTVDPGRRGVVIATVPPAAACRAGARIARRLGWPLILDYRDPWTAYPWSSRRLSPRSRWLAHWLESGCVRQSRVRVFNTSSMAQWFEHYFPAYATGQNFVITNGFDAPVDAPPPLSPGPLRVMYAGQLYSERSLVPVLTAISNLAARGLTPHGIQLVFYGELPAHEHARVQARKLEQYLDVRARLPWREMFAQLRKAHVLLAISGDDVTYAVPFKVYDYLAAGRPILALTAAETALHRFMGDSGAGECAHPTDVLAIEQALESLLFPESDSIYRAAPERYLWSNLALQYRGAIEAALEEPVPAIQTQAWQLQR
jgi:hypothetical protein